SKAYTYRGAIHCQNKKYALAAADFTSAIRFDPKCTDAILSLAICRGEMGETTQALDDVATVLTMEGSDPNVKSKAVTLRGRILMKQGKIEQAIADFSSVLDSDANCVSALRGRGEAYYRNGNLQKALKDFDQALKGSPQDEHSLFLRA